MVKADGSVGSFDTGAQAIMTPSLGKSIGDFWAAKHAVSDMRTRIFSSAAIQGVPGDDSAKVTDLRASLSRLFHQFEGCACVEAC